MPPSNRDTEMNIFPNKEDSLLAPHQGGVGGGGGGGGRRGSASAQYTMREPLYEDVAQPKLLERWVDSFRRDPNQRLVTEDPELEQDIHAAAELDPLSLRRPMLVRRESSSQGQGVHYYDVRRANLQTAHSHLARRLKGRHLQMIAIGGSIGTGLFVASGRALEVGGPASVLIAYSFIGTMLYCTVQALGELAVAFPVAGSFSAYSTRFLDPSWGFAMGWNYALQWLVVLPLEIIAASITLSYWNPNINKAIFVTVFLVFTVIINFFGVKGYGEAEFVFAIIKVVAVIGFILLGIVLNIGGGPGDGYIGVQYWRDPGAFHNGFKGLCSVFVTAAFAFAGTELVGLAAAETANPRKSLPTAIKQVFWRITLFYIVSLTLIGLLVPYDDPRLLLPDDSAAASPFVIAIENAGIEVLPSVMNVVILIAVLSVGNSSVFGSSRTLAALADQGQAPRCFAYIDRRGRPLVAIIIASLMGLLAYLANVEAQANILEWFLSISGLSSIFTWGSICLAHIRFRQAWARRGHSVRELAFTAQCGVAGSWLGFVFNALVLIAQFWVGLWPVEDDLVAGTNSGGRTHGAAANYSTTSGGGGGFNATDAGNPGTGGAGDVATPYYTTRDRVRNLFLQYMAVPIVVVFYVGHRLWYRTSVIRIDDMDLDTGRRDFNLPILVAQEREERKGWPAWKKVYKFLC